jgi:two-component system response regulator MtrA
MARLRRARAPILGVVEGVVDLTPKVLIVEDDAAVRDAASLVLERAGFEVEGVSDGADAVDRIRRDAFDLVVLDIMLPSKNGFDVCREVRSSSGVPIVMLTARADTEDVVAGLELGADDYVTKPFEPAELAARARAAVRRHLEAEPTSWQARDLEIDEEAFRAQRAGTDLLLTATEFKLLVALGGHAGQVMTREALLERVWGYDYLGDSRLVDMAVRRLRRKLGDPPEPPPYITTIRAVGYRFERG